jgi:hypothetical protein
MKKSPSTWFRFIKKLRKFASLRVLVWIISICAFISIAILLQRYYPRPIKIDSMDKDITLITQILSIIIGISLIGITVHLSSYSLSDKLIALLEEIETTTEPIYEPFFGGHSADKKLDNSDFNKYIFRSVKIDRLIFSDSTQDSYPDYYVFRPYWDGVWYQVFKSPFKDKVKEKDELVCVAHLHEMIICAAKALGFVYELRKSGSCLLSPNIGSQGSRWFLEELGKETGKLTTLKRGLVPDELSKEEGFDIVSLAVYSTHYMWDELSEYSENVNWDPYKLSQFQVIFLDYFLWLSYFIAKFQLLRMAIIKKRFPYILKKLSDKTRRNLFLQELADAKEKISDVRRKSISELGVSKHYFEVKRSSIPGIGFIPVCSGSICDTARNIFHIPTSMGKESLFTQVSIWH